MLGDILTHNQVLIRNKDKANLSKLLNNLYPGIVAEVIVENFSRLSSHGDEIFTVVEFVMSNADNLTFEKLREAIRNNPSSSANWSQVIMKGMEMNYIKNELAKRRDTYERAVKEFISSL
ncbi:hypothetical protein PFISCL1PPCAC_5572 [Pristionchus fissidentatus]|uniref:Uncharacterized protein n=1 Tax=Pristionchus fissidentatus TaxID=1538716 RepID=A0AAV5V6W3_9BILA|nr:hypothetical protein PFISCL1PPCAC_5572 [Pristionchus fissidentatus]